MKGRRLRIGMHVKLQGQEYSIEQRLSDGQLQLKHIATGTLSAKSDHDIVRALFEGVAELVGNKGEAANLEERREWPGVNDFEALEDGDPRKIASNQLWQERRHFPSSSSSSCPKK